MTRVDQKPEFEGNGFDERVPEELIDVLANPPAAWVAKPEPPAPPSTPTRSRMRRLGKWSWTSELPFRVHFYDPTKTGTWVRYFATRKEAAEFAVGKTLWSEPALVETKPRARKPKDGSR